MSVSSNHSAGPAVPLWLSSHKVLTWEKVSVYLKAANHAEVLKKVKIYCRHVQLGTNLARSHRCLWRKKDLFVSQAAVFDTFSDALFHSRKPYVNLLKNMTKIIVVSWGAGELLSAGCCQNHTNGMVWGGRGAEGFVQAQPWLHKEPAEQSRCWFSVPLKMNHGCKVAAVPLQTSEECR